jgi:chromosome segregation ATPase
MNSPASPSSSSNVAALQAEVHQLLERLQISNEWNMRLNQQISELTQLPPGDVQEMRQRMLDPDIAIPLLQCYDAVIQEKTEEADQLRKETLELRAQLDAFHRDQLDVSNAVRMAEDLAKSVQGKASEEVQRYVTAVKELQEEVVRLRLEVTRALDSENAAKQTAQHAADKTVELEKALDAARQEARKAQELLQAAEQKWRQQEQQAGAEQTGLAVQQVQQQLLRQENADKTQELERLRAKMIQALRQTSDNHAAHLRIVEERHRMIVEDLRSVNRTQELEMLKLRAQLARWDPSNRSLSSYGDSGSGSGGGHALRMQSTGELLEAQARQAREMEVKRLYGEVSALQQQRDDALRQYEQLTSRLQRDRDQQVQEAQRQLQSVQRSLSDTRVRCEELEATKSAQEASLRQTREELRRVQQEAQQARLSFDSQTHRMTALQQQLAEAAARIAAAEEERKRLVQHEQQRSTELEGSVASALKDVQEARERAYAEVEEVQRRHEQLQHSYQHLQEQLRERQQAVETKERARSILELQMGKLEEGLEGHKRRLAECDRRIQQLEGQLNEARQQQRSSCVTLEQLKIRNHQLTRARDQLAEMLQGRSF